MSKTVTHLDLDDVLTSIRRLVSVPAEETAVASQSPAPLILTPVFRVKDGEPSAPLDLSKDPERINDLVDEVHRASDADQEQAEYEKAPSEKPAVLELTPRHAAEAANIDQAISAAKADRDPQDNADADVASELPAQVEDSSPDTDQEIDPNRPAFADAVAQEAEHTSLEDRIAELERAVSGGEDQFEPDGSEPQEQHQPKLHFLERYRERFGEPEQVETGEEATIAKTPSKTSDQNEVDAHDQDANAEAPAADDATLIDPHVEVEHEAADASQSEPDEPTPESVDKIRESIIANLAERLISESVDETTEEASPIDASSSEPDERPAEEVAVFMRARPNPEPVDTHDEPTASETPEVLEPIVQPSEPEQVLPAAQAVGELVTNDEEFLVDEETLRSVVADIVRDELQGRLGERITRNVRRMVRQEIEKAISLKSLE